MNAIISGIYLKENQMENILIIGASGHAKVIVDIIEKQNQYNIYGFLDTFKKKNVEGKQLM